jgi:hypothetical protein
VAIKDISDTGDQVLRKAAVDLLTGGKKGIDYALRVISLGLGPIATVNWDSWNISETSLTDIVTWYDGGLAGTPTLTFTATYTNTRKKKVVSGEWLVL